VRRAKVRDKCIQAHNLYINGMSVEEIARKTGATKEQVRARIVNNRRSIKRGSKRGKWDREKNKLGSL
jgi:uncharacterized protein YjcR